MALYDVHIGWLGKDGALDWGGDSAIDNIHYRQGPLYTGWGLYNLIKKKIESSDIPGKQVDWGAWAASVTKEQILSLMDECWGEDRPIHGEFEEFVRSLRDNKKVALVASFDD